MLALVAGAVVVVPVGIVGITIMDAANDVVVAIGVAVLLGIDPGPIAERVAAPPEPAVTGRYGVQSRAGSFLQSITGALSRMYSSNSPAPLPTGPLSQKAPENMCLNATRLACSALSTEPHTQQQI